MVCHAFFKRFSIAPSCGLKKTMQYETKLDEESKVHLTFIHRRNISDSFLLNITKLMVHLVLLALIVILCEITIFTLCSYFTSTLRMNTAVLSAWTAPFFVLSNLQMKLDLFMFVLLFNTMLNPIALVLFKWLLILAQ